MSEPLIEMQNVETIIEMKNIEKHFGSVIALSGVSLDLLPGECHVCWATTAPASRHSSRPCPAFMCPRQAKSFLRANR